MLKVLIAEDDLMIADIAEEMLSEAGYAVCGIAPTVEEAVALFRRHKPDLVLLDLRLADGGLGTEIVAQLGDELGKTGVLYASGNISNIVLTSLDGEASLTKPYCSADLVRSLEIVAGLVNTGTASLPFPYGFKLLPTIATGSVSP